MEIFNEKDRGSEQQPGERREPKQVRSTDQAASPPRAIMRKSRIRKEPRRELETTDTFNLLALAFYKTSSAFLPRNT